MYNRKASKEFYNISIPEIIKALQELPQDMTVYFNGTNKGYLHVDTEQNFCSFDSETDDEWYESENESEVEQCE